MRRTLQDCRTCTCTCTPCSCTEVDQIRSWIWRTTGRGPTMFHFLFTRHSPNVMHSLSSDIDWTAYALRAMSRYVTESSTKVATLATTGSIDTGAGLSQGGKRQQTSFRTTVPDRICETTRCVMFFPRRGQLGLIAMPLQLGHGFLWTKTKRRTSRKICERDAFGSAIRIWGGVARRHVAAVCVVERGSQAASGPVIRRGCP